MTIQTINLAVPGGDTPRSANTKVNANFSDPTHAASKHVGTATGQIPLAQDTYSVVASKQPTVPDTGFDMDNALPEVRYAANVNGALNLPPANGEATYIVETRYSYQNTTPIQIATGKKEGLIWVRSKIGGVWNAWRPQTSNRLVYSTTTASGANTVVTPDGTLQRSTSSERYKDILAPLVLDDAKYAQAMSLKPIVYRSTAEADNPAHHYYSFSAEELGSYDPAFTLWRTTEVVTDAEGNITEQPLAEKQAEGININALLAMSHAIAIKQDDLIKKLEARIAALEPKPVTNNP